MNNSAANDQLQNISLVNNLPLQHNLLWSFILWICIGFANSLASLCNTYIFLVWKPMQKDTSLLVVQMSVVELAGGIILMSIGCFHTYSAIMDVPETRKMIDCWLIVCWDMLTETFIGIVYLELSFDRFVAAIFPIAYQNRTKHYVLILSIISWSFAIAIYFCSLIAVLTSNIYVPICLLRYSLGILYFSICSYTNLILSIAAVICYLLIIIILKCQVRYIAKRGGNVGEVKKRMESKVSKALALSAVAHLLTFTTAALGVQLVTYLLPFNGGTFGPFFNTFYHFGSLTSLPIYFLFQKAFRTGLKHLMKNLFTFKWSMLTNSAVHPVVTVSNHYKE